MRYLITQKKSVFIFMALLQGCISYRPISVDASDHFYIIGNTACIAAAIL
jgi:hypothetical protein